jgi:hypothetical protein
LPSLIWTKRANWEINERWKRTLKQLDGKVPNKVIIVPGKLLI